MKKTPLYLGITLLSISTATAQTIFDHTFDGGTGNLNGTAEDYSGENWIAVDGEILENGVTTVGSGAVLPYNFGAGVYEFSAGIDQSFSPTNSTGFASVYFTVGDPVTAGFINGAGVEAYGTFGLRGNGDFEIWGGPANSGTYNVGGGNLTDYGFTLADDRTGTLRMVLDTTDSVWTIAGYYTPDGKTEAQIDLNGGDSGLIYSFSDNQPEGPITGAGIIFSQTNDGNPVYESFSLVSVPEVQSFALWMGLPAILCIAIRRRR